MIINVHAHLVSKEMWSDIFWDYFANNFTKTLGIPKETVIKNMLPQVWACNAENFVKVLDIAGIDKAVVTGVDWGMSAIGEAKWSVEEMNQWVAKQVDEYSDKLVALCSVDPRRGDRAVELLEKSVREWGMKGLKFHPTAGYYPDDPAYFPLYEKCIELDIPLFSHTAALITGPLESKYSDPIYLDSIAAKFPDLKIILLHFGGISWTYKCVEIMCARPNVYTEISGHQMSAVGMPQSWLNNLKTFLKIPPFMGAPLKDRIMFGTDWPFIMSIMLDEAWVDWIKRIPEKGKEYGLKFTQRDIDKILGENAKKILKL